MNKTKNYWIDVFVHVSFKKYHFLDIDKIVIKTCGLDFRCNLATPFSSYFKEDEVGYINFCFFFKKWNLFFAAIDILTTSRRWLPNRIGYRPCFFALS
jgi:hypothetical protein